MSVLSFFTKIYECLHDYEHVHTKLLMPFRVFIRYTGNWILPSYLKNHKIRRGVVNEDIIVSLTSFPTRIDTVWMTICSLLQQTICPHKVILWLSNEQFPEMAGVPQSLLDLQNDLFEIKLVPEDIRSHKKYYYAFRDYPEKIIITADDDILYTPDMIERLMTEHNNNPSDVLCCFGVKMMYSKEGKLKPYNSWVVIPYKQKDKDIVFFGSGGGTLFPPKLIREEVLNKEKFLQLTPTADDVWLNAMVKSSGITVKKIPFGQYFPIIKRQDEKLFHINVGEERNDIQIRGVQEYLYSIDGKDPFGLPN